MTADPAQCRPELIAAVVDCNPDTVALTGNDAVLVRGRSTARAFLSAYDRMGANITKINVCGTAFDVAEAVVELPGVTTGVFQFSATDSRGYTTACEETLEMIPYFDVECHIAAGRNDPTSGACWLDIEGSFYKGSFGAKDNSLTVTYSINNKVIDTYTCDPEYGGFSERIELEGLDYDKSHTIEVTVWDKLSEVTKSVRIQPGIPIFDWGQSDFNFNVPVNMPRLMIQKSNVADWIVEQGSDGIWIYRKWASGLAECWGSASIEVTGASTEWGSLFESDQVPDKHSYPIHFVKRPTEMVTAKSTDVDVILISGSENTQGMTGSYSFAMKEVQTDVVGLVAVITVDYYVAGLWKQEENAQ